MTDEQADFDPYSFDITTLPILPRSLSDVQNILGASLMNLLERCIGLPPDTDEHTYIRDNAMHVADLMAEARDLMEELGAEVIYSD